MNRSPITAIIPCIDATALTQTIDSLKNQTLRLAEILVVSDGIDLGEIEGVRVISNPSRIGKVASINRAIRLAQDGGVLCIDADTELAPDGLEIMSRYLIDEIKLVVPSINPKKKSTWIEKGRAEMYERANRMGFGFGLIGCCFLSTKEYLLAHPFSSETLVEDQDFAEGMARRGERFFHSFRANCFTLEPDSLSKLVKQESRWFYGSMQVERKHHPRNILALALAFIGFPVLALLQSVIGAALSNVLVLAVFFVATGLMYSNEVGGLHEVMLRLAGVLAEAYASIQYLFKRKRKW